MEDVRPARDGSETPPLRQALAAAADSCYLRGWGKRAIFGVTAECAAGAG